MLFSHLIQYEYVVKQFPTQVPNYIRTPRKVFVPKKLNVRKQASQSNVRLILRIRSVVLDLICNDKIQR